MTCDQDLDRLPSTLASNLSFFHGIGRTRAPMDDLEEPIAYSDVILHILIYRGDYGLIYEFRP